MKSSFCFLRKYNRIKHWVKGNIFFLILSRNYVPVSFIKSQDGQEEISETIINVVRQTSHKNN